MADVTANTLIDMLSNHLRTMQQDGSQWLCFRLQDDDDVVEVGTALLRAYCQLYQEELGREYVEECSAF